MTDKIKVTQHLCLTEAGCCVVPETHLSARWLHWATGTEVDAGEYARMTDRGKCCRPILKTLRPAANKARRPGQNK